jgi:hypothetical protein
MQIDLLLNQEQLDAIGRRVAGYNAASGQTLTSETFLARSIMADINGYVTEDFSAAVARLGQGAATLPYEARLALIAQVESQLAPA